MEQIKIRGAQLSDLDSLLTFEQGIIKTERPFDVTLKEGHINYYDIKQMILSDDVEVAVAELGSEVIGSGYARIENSKMYLKYPRHAYLGFMYVDPNYRGIGVNQKIIAYLTDWSRSRSITELRLEVYDQNLPAIKAYEKAGFSKLLLQMRMGIE